MDEKKVWSVQNFVVYLQTEYLKFLNGIFEILLITKQITIYEEKVHLRRLWIYL